MIRYTITFEKMKKPQFEQFRLWFSTLRRSIFIDLSPAEKRFYSLNAKSLSILEDRIILEYSDEPKFLKFLECRLHRLIIITLREIKNAGLEITGKNIVYRDFMTDIYRAAGYSVELKVVEDEKAVIAKMILEEEEKLKRARILSEPKLKKPIIEKLVKEKPIVKIPKKTVKSDFRSRVLQREKIKKPKSVRGK